MVVGLHRLCCPNARPLDLPSLTEPMKRNRRWPVVAVDDEYERHRLLVMIEQMQREGHPEPEIVAALRGIRRHGPRLSERAPATRRTRGRLMHWALMRRWA